MNTLPIPPKMQRFYLLHKKMFKVDFECTFPLSYRNPFQESCIELKMEENDWNEKRGNLLGMEGSAGHDVLEELATNAPTTHQKQRYILHSVCLSVFFASSLYEF
jgi:hypothetical protein